MARPSEYSDQVHKKARAYLTEYRKQGDVIPSIEGLAGYLGVVKNTLYNWAEKHPEFLNTLGELKDKQAQITLNKGLIGKFNPTISKLLLSNHDYVEKQNTDITSGGKAVQITGMQIIKDGDSIQDEEPETAQSG